MIKSDYDTFIKTVETHKARLLTNLEAIKDTTPFQLDTVKTQFYYMLRDLDKNIRMGSTNETTKQD